MVLVYNGIMLIMILYYYIILIIILRSYHYYIYILSCQSSSKLILYKYDMDMVHFGGRFSQLLVFGGFSAIKTSESI